jgi:MFS family permease
MNKKNISTFVPFLFWVALWSFFFSAFQFFIWNLLQKNTPILLSEISGYLSFWVSFAYLLWGALAFSFIKKHFIIGITFLTLIYIIFIWFFVNSTFASTLFFIGSVGFLYGLWTVLKNIITSIEIKKTGLGDTFVNGITNIVFIIFVITGSIFGNILYEKFWEQGSFFLMIILICIIVCSFFLNYDIPESHHSLISKNFLSHLSKKRETIFQSFLQSLPEWKKIWHRFYGILIWAALLWGTSTVISQQLIEYSVKTLQKTPPEASFLFLYSSFWLIFGILLSLKMVIKRQQFFLLSLVCYHFLFISFFLWKISFFSLSLFAVLVWLSFWIASNLVDGLYFKKIGDEKKDEYGASLYGFIISATIFITATFQQFLMKITSLDTSFIAIGILSLVVSWYFCIYKKILSST